MKFFVDSAIPEMPFWDFCCDHGYIGIAALKTEKFSAVYFVDQIPHIIQRLKLLFEQSPQKTENYQFDFFDCGGENINIKVYGNVIIAGVGGRTIVTILKALKNKNNLHANRLILSPHLDINFLKDYISNELHLINYTLVDTAEINENGRVRPVFILDKY